MATGEAGYRRIGSTPACALSSFFPQAVRAFRTRYPLVTISLSEMTSKEQIAAITKREIDIGFFRTPTPLKQSHINFTYITAAALVVAMYSENQITRSHSLHVRALQDYPPILFSSNTGLG